MLHVDSVSHSTESAVPAPSTSSTDTPIAANVTALFSTMEMRSRPSIFLATARVKISLRTGRQLIVRALLDQGSEITFISERLVRNLKLRRLKMPISVSAVGGVDAGTCRYAAHIQISPCNSSQPVLSTTASILNVLTRYSSPSELVTINWSHLSSLALADSDPMSADPINVIVGADLYSELILDGVRKGSSGQPIAQNTIFGWVISGPASAPSSSRKTITVQHCSSSVSLDQELRRF